MNHEEPICSITTKPIKFINSRDYDYIAQVALYRRMLSGRLLMLRSSSRGFCLANSIHKATLASSSQTMMSTMPLLPHGSTNRSLCQRSLARGVGTPTTEIRVSRAFGKISKSGVLSTGYYLNINHRRSLSISCDAARKVSCEEAFKLAKENGYQYLDVRTPEEFAAGHPDGAINVPVMIKDASGNLGPNPAFLDQVKKNFPDLTTSLCVGCQAGVRSEKACSQLESANYSDVINVSGGYKEWEGCGLPTSCN